MNPVPHGPSDLCPLLTAVLSDRLWVTPTSMYCRRPDGRVRVPARSTLIRVCTTRSFATCPGYRAATAPGAADGERRAR